MPEDREDQKLLYPADADGGKVPCQDSVYGEK